jgi:hypothetical protein
MLAWRKVALLYSALVGKALRALEEQLGSVAAAKAADGSCITCHFLSPDTSVVDRFTRRLRFVAIR